VIEWSPVVGEYLVDEAYIRLPAAMSDWSDEEKRLLREHYQTASRKELEEMFPSRSWSAIMVRANHTRLQRQKREKSDILPDKSLSLADWQLIQAMNLPLQAVLDQGVVWQEYIGVVSIGIFDGWSGG
jgi:hypothetical protein